VSENGKLVMNGAPENESDPAAKPEGAPAQSNDKEAKKAKAARINTLLE
jgi:hypothetical protein